MKLPTQFAARSLLAASISAATLAAALTNPLHAGAQSQQRDSAASHSFDVASVKVSDSPIISSRFDRAGGHIAWTTDLFNIIEYAYGVRNWQISGPVPGSSYAYAIEAVTDPKTTDDQVRLMFQSLLADRFKMAVHEETKDAPGYALAIAKGGLKIQEATDAKIPPMPGWLPPLYKTGDPAGMEHHISATLPSSGVVLIIGRRVTMQQLSENLSVAIQSPVFDLTGLHGEYYFAFEYAEGADTGGTNDLPPLPGALKLLGFNFEKHTGPVKTIIVDHIEKVPTEN